MAKRIVCCPVVGASEEKKFEYLYVDTSKLLVRNVTGELGAFLDDVQGRCCFDALSGYVLGDKVLSDEHKKALPFKLAELNSLELFKNVDELRLKTGSEKIISGCLLNYYRREYDETQQHTFFSEPGVSNTYVAIHDGVEHELTIEDRTWVKKKKEEFELETLDKGKTDAEREAEAELAQLELAQAEALAEAEEAALKKDDRLAKRKKHNRLMEEEQYREFRNQDDVQNAQYRQLRELEEEMRRNNDTLAAEYDDGNYNSLPGWVPENEYADFYESAETETVGIPVKNSELYGLASRMDEFGVPYTVVSESFNDGTKHSVLCYSSAYAETGELARDFYELELALQSDNVVDKGVFYSAFQLSALDYAYANNVDVFYVRNGEFNGNQMYRVVDAGLNGYDMAVLANAAYTPAHMDALSHYMSFGWNTDQISDPSLSPSVLADKIMCEEFVHGVSNEFAFFERYDYDSFLSYKDSGYVSQFNNEYDAKVQDFYRHNEQQAREAASREAFDEFKENLHAGYEERQREMNYLPTEGSSFGVPYDSDYTIPGISADYKQDYVPGGSNVNGGHNHDTFKDVGVVGGGVVPDEKPHDFKPVAPGVVDKGNGVSAFGGNDKHFESGAKSGTQPVDSRGMRDEQRQGGFGVEMRPESLKGGYGRTQGDSSVYSGKPEQTGYKGGSVPSGGFKDNGHKTDVKGGPVPTEHIRDVGTKPDNIGKNVKLNNGNDNAHVGTGAPVPGGKQIDSKSDRGPAIAGGLNTLGSSGGVRGDNGNGSSKPYSFNAAYTPTGRIRSDSTYVPYSNKASKGVSTGAKVLATGVAAGVVGAKVAADIGNKKIGTAVDGAGKVVSGASKVAEGTGKVINSASNKSGALNDLGVNKTINNKTPKETVKPETLKQDGKKTPTGDDVIHKTSSNNAAFGGANFNNGRRGPETSKSKPAGAPINNKPSIKKNYPLNDLKVRSDFAHSMGLRVRNYGSNFLHSGSMYTRMTIRQAFYKIANNDETGAIQAYNKITRTGGNVLLTARLVMDVPRNVMRVGQGISYTGNAIANAGRRFVGDAPVKKSFTPLSSKAYVKEIKTLQAAQVAEIKKKFGAKAVKLDARAIDKHVKKISKDISLLSQKQDVLRKEIGDLYKKKRSVGLNKTEKLKLKEKLKLFNDNNKALRKNNAKKKKLSDLKGLKKAHEKALGVVQTKHGRYRKKDGRMKNLPSRLGHSFVSQLYKAGDDITASGIASASNFALGVARNPITRVIVGVGRNFIVKPAAWVAKKTVINPAKKAIKKSKAYEKHLKKKGQRLQKRKAGVQKVKAGINKKAEKTFGKKTVDKTKKTVKKTSEGVKKVSSAIAKPFKAVGNAFDKVGSFFSGIKASILKYLLIGLGAILGLVIIIVLLSFLAQAVSSFVLVGDESSDGRINLTYYVDKLEGFQDDLQAEIQAIENQPSSTGQEYDNVFYDYNGPAGGNNMKHILAMSYVRFDLDIDCGFDLVERGKVVDYMEQLYKDSNFVDYAESAPYECDNGCEERSYKCYDPIDRYVTETRKNQFLASNHGVHGSGCKKGANYSCMTTGHKTYNKYGCSQHNKGLPMTSKGGCTNYTTRVIPTLQPDGSFKNVTYYYCQGHCNKSHYDYSCPGHKETICRGKHVDVTITITSLGFDEIFAVDSSVAQTGSTIRGDAYEAKFTITGYCPCVICCGKSDGITASGVKAQANHTIAVDPNVIPLGTHVWIDGREYVAEDTGGAIKGNRIDMYFSSHAEALRWGVRTKTIYKSQPVEDGFDATKDDYSFVSWDEDAIKLAKHLYDGLAGEECDEIYEGLDGISDLSYGYVAGEGAPIDFDFSSIVYEDGTLTAKQQKILDVIEANTVATKAGYCQAWVARVYQAALGGAVQSRCCANHAGQAWGASNDWGSIQVGASVYGYGRSKYGHVGIYIGGGMVAHNIGYVKVESLESWVKTYNGQCWGWNGGVNLTGNSKYNCKAAGYYMHGKD